MCVFLSLLGTHVPVGLVNDSLAVATNINICFGAGYDLCYGSEFSSVTCLDCSAQRSKIAIAVAFISEGNPPPSVTCILMSGVEAGSVGVDTEVVDTVDFLVYSTLRFGVVSDRFAGVS